MDTILLSAGLFLSAPHAPIKPQTAFPIAAPSGPAVVVASKGAEVVDWARFRAALSASDVVLVGEQHDLAAHHLAQLDVLREFHSLKPGLSIGLEMVDRTQQASLDEYLSGAMSEADFAAFWKKAWGYDFAIYRPLLAYAKDHHIPVKGLNAPLSVIRQISKGGLSSLSPAQRALLPARVEQTSDARYLAYIKESLSGHGADPARLERMLEAMAAWNETMGQAAADALAQGPVLVIAGSGHMLFRAGIAESLGRRASAVSAVVLPYPLDGEHRPVPDLIKELQDPASKEISLGDYFQLLP